MGMKPKLLHKRHEIAAPPARNAHTMTDRRISNGAAMGEMATSISVVDGPSAKWRRSSEYQPTEENANPSHLAYPILLARVSNIRGRSGGIFCFERNISVRSGPGLQGRGELLLDFLIWASKVLGIRSSAIGARFSPMRLYP